MDNRCWSSRGSGFNNNAYRVNDVGNILAVVVHLAEAFPQVLVLLVVHHQDQLHVAGQLVGIVGTADFGFV